MNKKILVHTCCAPCATYSLDKLVDMGYEPTLFFYNPNIHPEKEYQKRLDELVLYAQKKDIPLIIEDADVDNWFELTKNNKTDKEGGARCLLCFEMRLQKSALIAKEKGIGVFTTVLTISPHKNSSNINKIGSDIAQKYDIEFLEENFKKNDGFKKSLELSKKYELFRQNYCGCIYSIRDNSRQLS